MWMKWNGAWGARDMLHTLLELTATAFFVFALLVLAALTCCA